MASEPDPETTKKLSKISTVLPCTEEKRKIPVNTVAFTTGTIIKRTIAIAQRAQTDFNVGANRVFNNSTATIMLLCEQCINEPEKMMLPLREYPQPNNAYQLFMELFADLRGMLMHYEKFAQNQGISVGHISGSQINQYHKLGELYHRLLVLMQMDPNANTTMNIDQEIANIQGLK